MEPTQLVATFTPAESLAVGTISSLGEIVAIRTTAKRVYTTIKLATSGEMFEDHQPRGGRVVTLNRVSANGPEIAAAMMKAASQA
jgi:hypothetical protein